MARATKPTAESGLRTLFEAGSVIGRSDGELLDRFLGAGGPAAELAFTTLVEWHGPMVWRVCLDVLREPNDADDAFQATFLILARRAGSIRQRSSLGPWLYGVALRVARSARGRAARRRDREQSAEGLEQEEARADVDRLDAAPILHEEVGRLPEKYRTPLVLCYFEGLTHDQAASRLGWPVGTVRSRLSKARERLRPRLLRRGLAPSVAILGPIGRAEAMTVVPRALVLAVVGTTVRAGGAGTVPATVAALAGTTLREMTLMKAATIVFGLVATALVSTAGVGFIASEARPQGQDQDKPASSKPANPVPKADGAEPVPTASEPGRNRSNPQVSNVRIATTPARVLWARLTAAASNLGVAQSLFESARGKYNDVIAARGEFDALAAELSTSVDDLRDEVELLEAQLKIKEADVQVSKIQQAKAALSLQYVQKLAATKGVSDKEVVLYQNDVDLRAAESAKKQAEFDEIALRIKQATRRRDEATALAKRAEGLVPDPKTPKDSSAPAPKQ